MRFAPGIDALRGYQRSWLRGDVLAGITVAAYLIPQVMAYAEVAGLPAVVGLWTIIGTLAVYAVLGSSRQLSVGPESTTALMSATAIAPLAGGDPARYAALAAGLGLMVGLLCVIGWAVRLGFVADLLSRPVLVGYLAGVAVIMIVSQLGKVTKIKIEGDSLPEEVWYFLRHVDESHGGTVALAAAMLTFLFTMAHFFPKAPVPLVGVMLATVAVAVFSLDEHGIRVIGDIPSGLPTPGLPDLRWADVGQLLLPAFGVALVAYNDNVLTARAFAERNGYAIDNNQELLALGAANAAGGLMHGFPVSSSASRTVIGDTLGSKSQVYSLVALASVVLALLFLGPVLSAFPIAALGALVMFAAVRLVEIGELKRFARFRRSELILALATTASVLVFDILYGVLAAVALSLLDLLRRVARPPDASLGYVPGVPGMHDMDDYPNARAVPGLVVYRYDSPLFFANASDFKRRALAAVDDAEGPVEWFVMNAEANVEVDITSMDALDELRAELTERGVVFAMARVKQELRDDLRATGLWDRIGGEHIFMTLPTAVQAYLVSYVAKNGSPPPGITIPAPPQAPI